MILPKARREDLVVQDFPDEVLVYDVRCNKAHCLNRTSGFVWRHCDGRTSVAKITKKLSRQMQTPVDEEVVWLALDQLAGHNLLEQGVAVPMSMNKISRRRLVRTLATAAVMAPLVTSIVAPTAAQAATCLPIGASCLADGDCCSQNCNTGTCGPEL